MKELAKNKRVICGVAVLIQIAICIMLFSRYRSESTLYDFSVENIVSDSIIIDNFLESQESGYYIDSSEGGGKEDFAVTPPVNLKFGMYKVVFHYRCSEGNTSYIFASENMDFREWLGNYHKTLPVDKETYTTNLWLSRRMPNFEVKLSYGGGGYSFINRIEIIETRNWVIGTGVLLMLVFLCTDVIFVFKDRIKAVVEKKEWKSRALVLCAIILFTSFPLSNYYMFKGHDLYFHLLRIEGIKEGLQSGQLPVRMQPNWMNGYGYGVSLFYGDILLYFPAFLRMMGLGVQTAYKSFILFINILTVGIAYYSFKRLFRDEKMGLLGCMLYTTSIYRMACIYVRAAVGEYCALMFLPLIITAVYEILWQEEREENLRSSWVLGAIGFSGLIQTHLISTELTAVLAVIFCLVHWKRTFRGSALLQFVKMGLGILVCTCWFIIPFLDMFRGEYQINSGNSVAAIQTHGTFLGQLFNLFPYARGDALSHTAIEGVGIGDEMCYSIGGGLMAGAILFILYWINYGQKKNKDLLLGKKMLIISGILMVMTTVYFPWNDLSRLGGVLSFMIKNIEFPWRLLGLSTMFLTVLSLLTIKAYAGVGIDRGKIVCMIVLFFAVISSGYYEGRLINDNHTIYIQNIDDISTYEISTADYIPAGAKVESTYHGEMLVYSDGVLMENIKRRYQRFEISCRNETGNEGYVDLPLLYYKGYGVKSSSSDTEEEIKVGENDSGLLRITLPAGFSGNITVDYFGEWYWRAAEIVSLGGLVAFAVYSLYKRKYNKNVNN